MGAYVVAYPFGEKLDARVRRGCDMDAPFHCTCVLMKKALAASPGLRHRFAGLQETLPLGSQPQRSRGALDKTNAELLLDPLEASADGRGALVQLPSRLAQRACLSHTNKQVEIVEMHASS